MKDGHLNKCKECTKKDVNKRYVENPEKIREYEKSRANKEHRVIKRKEYLKTEAGKKSAKRSKMEYSKNNPKIRFAHTKVSNALRDGKLFKKSNCEFCGDTYKIEAHHCDYNKPLEILWLCEKCHKEWHKDNTPVY